MLIRDGSSAGGSADRNIGRDRLCHDALVEIGGGAQRYPLQPQQRERGEAEHRERDEHFDQSEAVFGGTPTKSEAVFGGTPARREAAITHRSSPCRRRRRSPRRAHRYAPASR